MSFRSLNPKVKPRKTSHPKLCQCGRNLAETKNLQAARLKKTQDALSNRRA